jgi:hypothetical protein
MGHCFLKKGCRNMGVCRYLCKIISDELQWWWRMSSGCGSYSTLRDVRWTPSHSQMDRGQCPEPVFLKRLWSPGSDSKEWIPPASVAWRAGTINLFLESVPSPHRLFKIPALFAKILASCRPCTPMCGKLLTFLYKQWWTQNKNLAGFVNCNFCLAANSS